MVGKFIDPRRRFIRILWGALVLYELLNVFFILLLRHLPPSPEGRAFELFSLLSLLLPLWQILSFRDLLPRIRLFSQTFFLWYFALGTFWLGAGLGAIFRFVEGILPGESEGKAEMSYSWEALKGGALLTLVFLGLAVAARFLPPRLIRIDLSFEGMDPRLEGTTILHLSDLHVGAWQGEGRLRTIADSVRTISPDILAVTGDVIDHREDEAQIFERIFSSLSGKLGTVAVLGNHEYWILGKEAWAIMRRHGLPVLKNESLLLEKENGGKIRVVGVDDPAGGEYAPDCGPDLEKALSGMRPGEFVLGLVHQPTLWEGALCRAAHLTLAGHTHGGQIGGHPPLPSLASLFFRHPVGLFSATDPQCPGHRLHVSAGLGYFGIPVRIGMLPEMTLVTLHHFVAEKSGEKRPNN
ncbi:MAG: metallophosphoesterase [Leptospirillia bacterium]